jgi:hypothetical protein
MTTQKFGFQVIDVKDRRKEPKTLALLKGEDGKHAALPFFDVIPLLEGINREHGTAVSLLHNTTFQSTYNPRNWRKWRDAVRTEENAHFADIMFPMLPFVAVGPMRKTDFAIAFKPDFDLYDAGVPEHRRNDKRAWFYLPPGITGIPHQVFAVATLTSADFTLEDSYDYVFRLPRDRIAQLRLPEYESWYKAERRFGLPQGKEIERWHGVPPVYFKFSGSKNYVGPLWGAVDLNLSDKRNVYFSWDWSRPSCIMVEFPVSDLQKLGGLVIPANHQPRTD